MRHSLRFYSTATIVVCALLTGCIPEAPVLPTSSNEQSQDQPQQNQPTQDQPEQVLAAPAPAPPTQEVEPNDDYAHATPVTVGSSMELQGGIRADASNIDLDFYALGPVQSGDTVTATLDVNPSDDVELAIMDGEQRVLAYLDPMYVVSGPSTINLPIYENGLSLYVLVTSRSASSSARHYTATIGLQHQTELPAARSQVIVLNFSGAQNVTIANRTGINIPVFDATVIDPRYAGDTNIMVNNVAEMVRESFDGLGVSIYVAGQGVPSGPHSTVHFGTYDSHLLGLAENIDPFNADLEQDAIVYADTFALFQPLSASVEEMSQALANVAGHEIGHLLGLRHTTDTQDLMDITASANQLLIRQWFRLTYLNSEVLPLGMQDAPSLLAWPLGGSLNPLSSGKQIAAMQKAINLAGNGNDFYIPRWQLMSHCNHHGQ